MRIFIEMIKYRYLFTYAVGTVIICAVLAKTMYGLGIRINHNRSSVHFGVTFINQIVGAVLHVAIFAIFKGRIIIDPCVILFTQYAKVWTTNDIIVKNPLSELIILCTFQTLIYSSVSLLFYFMAKRKQDRCKERPEY